MSNTTIANDLDWYLDHAVDMCQRCMWTERPQTGGLESEDHLVCTFDCMRCGNQWWTGFGTEFYPFPDDAMAFKDDWNQALLRIESEEGE